MAQDPAPQTPRGKDHVTRRSRPADWFRRSIRVQLSFAFTLLAVLPVALIALALAWSASARAEQALQNAIFDQLTTVRDDRARAVLNYFDEVKNDMAVLLETVDTLRQDAFDKLLAVNRNKTDALYRLFENWEADIADVSSDPGIAVGLRELTAGFQAAGASRVRSLYMGKELDDAGDGSAYSAAHREQHSFFTGYTEIHGYPDAFLIDTAGNVVYSVRKSDVFGTNLTSGDYKDTNLAQLYQRLKRAVPGEFHFVDMAPWDDGIAMFAGAPVYSGTLHIGVLVYQLPLDEINKIVQERTGLKPSTESFLIGKVGDVITYRSDRVIKEGVMGGPRQALPYDEMALVKAGQSLDFGSTNEYQINTYNPLDLPDLQWAILTTASAKENFTPVFAGETDDFYTKYIQKYGYYDLFLIDPNGYIFYSVKKEKDFETNILTGPYKNTNLAQLTLQVKRTQSYGVADFAFYPPSTDDAGNPRPAAFVAQPLVKGGAVELIVALQISDERLNEIIANYAGLGETGETLLAGPDKLARSKLRMTPGPWLLTTRLDTVAINSALQGNTSVGPIIDYRGKPVFNAWRPLDIPGADFRWAIAAKRDQEELLRPVRALQAFVGGVSIFSVLLVGMVAVVVGNMLARRLTQPIIRLTDGARAITAGNLDVALPAVTRDDEVGVLAGAFSAMTTRLRETISSLEARGRELQARTAQLEANQRAVRVTFAASGATDPAELLGLVVNLIRDQFNLYHVQIYIVDKEQQAAVLRESTGYAGRQLLQRKHQIPLDRPSLNTRAIHEAAPVLVEDVTQAPDFMPNPLLPDTRSELVVPLKAGDEVIGTLNAQSREVGTFTPDMVALFETLAEQVALLYQNAQLLERTAAQTEELTRFTTQLRIAADIAARLGVILDPGQLLEEIVNLMQSRFGFYHAHVYTLDEEAGELIVAAGSGEVGRILRERGHHIPVSREHSLVARAAREGKPIVVNDTSLDSDFLPNPLLPQTRAELAVPLITGGQVIGVLDIQDDQANRFSETDVATLNTLAGQVATALQNARLFEERQQAERALQQQQQTLNERLKEINCLYGVADLVERGELSLDEITQQVVALLPPAWQYPDIACARIVLEGREFKTPNFAETPWSLSSDIVVRGETVGRMEVRYLAERPASDEGPFMREERVLLNALAQRLADAIERRRADAEIKKRAAELQTVANVGVATSTILNPDELLQMVVDLTKQSFNLYHAHIYLLNEAGDTLVLAAGAGEPGRQMKAQGWQIPLNRERSLVARAARERRGVIVNDVRAEPDFLPNPLLPETRAEMAVPLIVGEQVLGVLDVQSERVGRFTQEDVAIKTTLAGQIASALRNAQLFAEQERSRAQMRTILESAPSGTLVTRVSDGTILYANGAAAGILGRAAEELLGRQTTEFYYDPADRAGLLQKFQAEGYIRDYELRFKRADGAPLWVLISIEPLTFEGEAVLLNSIVDITARREAEEAIKQLSRQNQLILGSAGEGIYGVDSNGITTFVNPAAVQMLGWSAEELVGHRHHDLIHHTKADGSPYPHEECPIYAAYRDGVTRRGDDEIYWRKDGASFPVAYTSTPIRDEQGNILGAVVTFSDITARKEAEAAIRESEEKFRGLLEYAPAAIVIVDGAGRIVMTNERAKQTFGYTEEEMLGQSIEMLVPVRAQDIHAGYCAGFREHPTSRPMGMGRDLTARRKDGSEVPVEIGLSAVQTRSGMLVMSYITDITERKRAEEALRQAALVLESSPVILFRWRADAEWSVELVSDNIAQFGYTPAELLSGETPYASIVHPDDIERVVQEVQAYSASGVERFDQEYRIITKDGQVRWTDDRTTIIRDAEGRITHYQGTVTDITERKQGEAERERLIAILTNSRDLIALTDMEGVVTYINPAGARLAGYEQPDQAVGKIIADFHAPEDLQRIQEIGIPVAFQEGVWRGENRILRTDGTIVPVDQAIFVIRDPQGKPQNLATIISDITARKQAEEELAWEANVNAALAALSEEVISQSTIDRISSLILEQAQKLTGSAIGFVGYIDPKTGCLVAPTLTETVWENCHIVDKSAIFEKFSGLWGWVLHNRQALLTNDPAGDPRSVGVPEGHVPIQRFLSAPALIGDNLAGQIALANAERDYTERDLALIERMAALYAIAIERRQAEAEIKKRAAELQTVAEVSTTTSTVLNPDELLQRVVDLTKQSFNLYHAHVYLLNEAGDTLVLAAGAGEPGRQMKAQGWQIPLNRERSLVARAARERRGVIVNDVRAEPDFLPNPLLPETRAEMAVPLIVGEQVLGVLDVQSEQVGRFTQEDVAIKTTLARQVAIALANARYFEEVQKTAERLREVDKLKSEFLANMSHELRTPLNSIIGYTEIMLMGIEGELTPEMQEDVQAIYDNGQHLLRLINDILDLAKIEAGHMTLNFEDVDIEPLLEDVQTNNAGLVLNKPVELRIDIREELPIIRADRVRLSQILTNLVSNAVKFTEQGSVTMRAYLERTSAGRDKWLCLEVEDTGIGMSEHDLEVIFERFRQVDGSSTRKAEGTGLGLSITRHLVQMHGGTIQVRSKLGEGSTFTVRLPIVRPETEEATANE